MVPRRLTEGDERDRMPATAGVVCLRGFSYLGRQFLVEQSSYRLYSLKHDGVQQHLASVGPNHPHRSNQSRLFIQIQIRSTADIDACIRKISRSLRIMSELRKKFFTSRNDFVPLAANFRHTACQFDVLVIAIHAPERIRRKSVWFGIAPSHNDAGVEATRERNTDALLSFKISRQIFYEDIA